MLFRSKNKIRYSYSLNPALSLTPILIYSFLIDYIGDTNSLLVGMIISLALIFMDYLMKRNISHPILLLSIFISFIVSYVYSLIGTRFIDIIFEISLIFQLMFILINKGATLKVLFSKEYVKMKANKGIVLEFFGFIRRIITFLSVYVILYIINSILDRKSVV